MSLARSHSQPIACFQVRLLGPLAVARDDTPLQPARWQRWVESLFILLATSDGRRCSRDGLVDTLWPDAAPRTGASNLRYIIYLLRQNLAGGDPSPILSERGWVALNPAFSWEVDLERFEHLLTSTEADDLQRLREAAALWHGEPLFGARFDHWALPLRARITREWRTLCLRLGRLLRAQGHHGEAVSWLERLLEDDPLDEEALYELLETLVAAGRVPEVLRRYRHYAEQLESEMGVAPGERLTQLVNQCRTAPPSRTSQASAQLVAVVPSYPLPRSGALVGRDAEVRALTAAFPTAERDGPRLILLAGEAGIGKTRLLAEIAHLADTQRLLVLAGGCYEQEGRLPYGPVHDALLDYMHAQTEVVLRAEVANLLPDLARIVPELRARLGAAEDLPREDNGDQRLRVFASMAQLLERVASTRPLLLLLDDLQWADSATLELLHFLLRQHQLTHLLVVGACRLDEVADDAPLARLASEAKRARDGAPTVDVLTLAPFDETATGTLLRARLGAHCDARLTTLIHRASSGNPFFALQMLDALREEGRLEHSAEAWQLANGARIDLPSSVRETVARRLSGLSAAEVEVLRTVAVVGRACAYRTLATIWDGDETALCAGLDCALDRHLLQEAGEGYAFPQPVLREVVFERIPLHRRRQLHGRAGRALRDLYGARADEHAAELAWHFLQADDPATALPYVVGAADQAHASYRTADAERQYRTALTLVQQTGERTDLRAEITLKLGRLLRATAQREEAVALLEEAAQLYHEQGDLVPQAMALESLAKTYLRSGMKEAASAALARVKALDEALARAAPSRDLAMLYDDLSDYYFRAGCYNDALATRERAIAVGTALADEHLLVRSEIGRVVTLSMLGQLRAADVAARGLIPRAQAAGNREALRLALAQVAEAAMVGGEFFQSREYRTRELSVARQVDPRLVAPFTRANLAQLTLYLGDWATAQRHAEQALKDLRAVGSVARAVYPLSFLGELALRRGDWPEAVRLLEECIAAAEPIGDVQVLRYAQRLLAERDTLDGHPDAALARLEPLLDRPGLEELDVAPLLVTLAWAYLTLGDVVTAAQRCAAGLARATAQGNCLARQDALRVSGMVLARQADWSQARSLFEEAATLARSMPYPYAEARALAEAGRLQGRRGGRERETIALRQAQAIFARLGAAWDAHRVEQTVAALT